MVQGSPIARGSQSAVAQGSASDGGGTGWDVPAIIWMAFTGVTGLFLCAFGLRGWRITTATALGLALAACGWAGIINTINANGLPDMVLTAIVLIFFAGGAGLGIFEIGRIPGMATLSIIGGLSLGMRVVLFRAGLLVPAFFANWLIVAAFGVLGLGLLLIRQRAGIVTGSALTGTFLLSFAVDLVFHKQSGMSLGLRTLFDKNDVHLVQLLEKPYDPELLTLIIMGVSIGISPALAYAQHRFFPEPFNRNTRPESIPDLTTLYPESVYKQNRTESKFLKSRFSL